MAKAGLRPPLHIASLACMPMPQPLHGCTVLIPVVISRPTPLILRRRLRCPVFNISSFIQFPKHEKLKEERTGRILRCPDGKRTSQLYTLSGLLRK